MDAISTRFPNESAEYRRARNALLDAEVALRRQVESVAAMRRALPVGGVIREDYEFDPAAEGAAPIRMSQLFAPGHDTLVVYSFMYGPTMKAACPSCTSILDALDGTATHLEQQVDLAVVARNPPALLREHAKQRGWRFLRLLSSARNSFNRDYGAEEENGNQNPLLHVFTRQPDGIHHRYTSELLWAAMDPGQDPRHVDMFWPLWNVLDYTPDGRGAKWHPRLQYDAPVTLGRAGPDVRD